MSDLRQLEQVQKYVDSLNKFYMPKSSIGRNSSQKESNPVEDLKFQFMGLKDQSSEVLRLYSEGI